MYGPNSPRSKEKVAFQESAIASALSDYASSKGSLQYVNADLPVQDACGSAGEVNMEAKPLKRHSGQRSRVRKVQYIAELERTVENLQNMVSELGVRVDSFVEQRIYLSLENKQLKQRLARLQQEKLFLNDEYECMRNEVEGLKLRMVRSHLRSNSVGVTDKLCLEPTCHMLDMAKLHIN